MSNKKKCSVDTASYKYLNLYKIYILFIFVSQFGKFQNNMTSNLPKGIQFKNVKPQGFYQEYRDYYVTPVQTYTNQFSVSDIVRMQFNLQDFYLDPYESYIEAEVRLADETKLDMTASVTYDGTNKV